MQTIANMFLSWTVVDEQDDKGSLPLAQLEDPGPFCILAYPPHDPSVRVE